MNREKSNEELKQDDRKFDSNNSSWFEYLDYYVDEEAFGECFDSVKGHHKLKCIRRNKPYYFACSVCLEVFQVEEMCLNEKGKIDKI